jgi:hypothetical protein
MVHYITVKGYRVTALALHIANVRFGATFTFYRLAYMLCACVRKHCPEINFVDLDYQGIY